MFPSIVILPLIIVQLFSTNAHAAAPTPNLVPIVTGTIDLGHPIPQIPIPSAVRIVEPLVGGTLGGSALNVTILGGLAYPGVYKNQTIQVPQILLYGNTSDNVPFLIQEAGVGSPVSQFTRIQLEIGGKYAALADAFIVASVTPNMARTQIKVEAFQVV